jgi:outer membrane protein OmpA-like peptidoglycan-associated protein
LTRSAVIARGALSPLANDGTTQTQATTMTQKINLLKRITLTIAIAILLLGCSNFGWAYYEWDDFLLLWRNASAGSTALLTLNIHFETLDHISHGPFGYPFGHTNDITLDGGNYIIDSNRVVNQGFTLTGERLIFTNVTFLNFVRNFESLEANGGLFHLIANSSLTFTGTINFRSNGSRSNAGGVFFSTNAAAYFTNGSFGFYENESVNPGGAIHAGENSTIAFTNSSTTFFRNRTWTAAGAVSLRDFSSFYSVNSTFSFIQNYMNGAAFYILRNSKVSFINSVGDFSKNSSFTDGGAILIYLGIASFENSTLNFANNEASRSGRGGAIFIEDATAYFKNSSITFKDNVMEYKPDNNKNDVYLNTPASKLIFDGKINLTNGIRTAGDVNGQIIKTGLGQIIFDGDATVIENTFNIEVGSAIFKADQSTINVLNMSTATTLSLISNNNNALYIDTNFTLNGFLNLDFNFASNLGDYIGIKGVLTINTTALTMNLLDFQATSASSIAFISATNIISGANLTLTNGGRNYFIRTYDNKIWLVYGSPWDSFVSDYKRGSNYGSLYENIYASSSPLSLAFGSPDSANTNFVINGSNFIVNSKLIPNLGFVINNSSLTFKDISFTSFTRTSLSQGGNGGLFNLLGSTIIFSGSVNLSFNKSGNNGGAIFVGNLTNLIFQNSNVLFSNNVAKNTINNGIINDIYLDTAKSIIIFDGNNILTNGIRTTGAGEIKKIGEGQVVFAGENTILNNKFTIVSGSAVFAANQSTINFLTMSTLTGLSLNSNLTNTLFINNDFELNGFLNLDFTFGSTGRNGLSDFIFINGKLTVNKSTLTLNFIDGQYATFYGSSVAFMKATNIVNFENLFLIESQIGYTIRLYNNMLWLYYVDQDPWNVFVGDKYKIATGTILLSQNISATDNSIPFSTPDEGVNNFTLDGGSHIINSGVQLNMGLVLDKRNVLFKDVALTRFRKTLGTNNGGAFEIVNGSIIDFEGAISFTSNSAINFGGAISAFSSSINFLNADVIFSSNGAYYGGAIFANVGSIISFTNSTITFVNNFMNSNNLSDIYFYDTASTLILNENVLFTNGLRSSGFSVGSDGQIIKTGIGQAIFAGNNSVIKNNFTIAAGSAVFFANQSTVSALTVSFGATLSMLSNSTNTLFINGNFNLSSYLSLDFLFSDFKNYGTGDLIKVNGNLLINTTYLSANLLHPALAYASSIAFMSANSVTNPANLTLLNLPDFQINFDTTNNVFWLYYNKGDPWNDFVRMYQGLKEDVILADTDIVAIANPKSLKFDETTNDNFTIDGNGKTINSNLVSDLNFVINSKTLNFKDINFTGFNSFDTGVILSIMSEITFMGEINFLSNQGFAAGGAMTAAYSQIYAQGAIINFINNITDDVTDEEMGGAIVFMETIFNVYDQSIINFTQNYAPWGGAIYGFQNSKINFQGSSLTFIKNTANYGASIMLRDLSEIDFSNSQNNFLENFSNEYGGVFYSSSSNISFNNGFAFFLSNKSLMGGAFFLGFDSNLTFTYLNLDFSSNSAQQGGAIYANNSVITFENSQINFTSNNALLLGGAIFADAAVITFQNTYLSEQTINFTSNSALSLGGAIFVKANSNITFINNNINFVANKAQIGGAIYLDSNDASIYFYNSKISFLENIASENNVGAGLHILNNSNITFLNSDIEFANNFNANGNIKNDIYLDGINATIIFDGNINLTNGLRSAGTGLIRKTGEGQLIFSGEDSLINNNFSLEAGSIVFKSNQNTLNSLTMNADTHISLINDDINNLTINSSLSLKGSLSLDFSFRDLGFISDFVTIYGNLTIAPNTILNVNFFDGQFAYITSQEIPFLRADAVEGLNNLTPITGHSNYRIEFHDLQLWLFYYGNDAWNEFVNAYQVATADAEISLTESIIARITSLDFSHPNLNANAIVINGNGLEINGDGIDNSGNGLGFIFDTNNATFKEITFTNFTRQTLGGVFAISLESLINFTGELSFINNSANSGGVIFANSPQPFGKTNIIFSNSSTTFRQNNVSSYGGAIALDNANLTIEKSTVQFDGNLSIRDGGAIFIDNASQIIFRNSVINFENNYLNSGSEDRINNDLYFNDANSVLIFDGQVTLENGIRTSGLPTAQIKKTNVGQIIFDGNPSKIENSFTIETGSAIFNSMQSSVSTLIMSPNTTLALKGLENKLYINKLTLNGFLDLDFTFGRTQDNWQSGAIIVDGDIIINDTILNVHLNQTPDIYGSSTVFLRGNIIDGWGKNIVLNINYKPEKFELVWTEDEQSVWLAYFGSAWDDFVDLYQKSNSGQTIILDQDIYPHENSIAFDSSINNNLTINGQNFIIDSGNRGALGFYFQTKTLSVMDTTFINFNTREVFNIVNKSSLTFMGEINFHLNNAGAIFGFYNSRIFIQDATVNFTTNTNNNSGGAISLLDNSTFSISGANVNFSSNTSYSNGGAIFLSLNSTVLFENSQIFFAQNFTNTAPNDIYLEDANSRLIFKGDVELINGIKTSGLGKITKTGNGQVLFASDSILNNTFNVEAGTAIFISPQSTITTLNITNSATLSLNSPFAKGGGGLPEGSLDGGFAVDFNTLFITSNLTLNGYLSLDFDFENFTSDFININAALTLQPSTLTANIITPTTTIGSSIAFMQFGSIINPKNLFLIDSPYRIKLDGNKLYLLYIDNWSAFVDDYKIASGTLLVNEDLSAIADSYSFLNPQTDNFIIDGKNHYLDSNNFENKNFSLTDKTLSFANIEFRNFNNTTNGGVFNLENSQVSFAGKIIFESNRANLGGAIFAGNNSKIIFTNNSTISFNTNFALSDGNDIYLNGENSTLELFGNILLSNGLRTSGTGQIIKTGNGNTIFAGNDTILNNTFTLQSATTTLLSKTTNIKTLILTNDATLSLNSPFAKGGGSEADGGFAVAVPAVPEGNSPFAKGGTRMGSEGGFAVNAEGSSQEIAGQARNDAERGVIAGSDPQSHLIINSNLTLNGYIAIDFDFTNSTSDFISILGELTINTSTLTINWLSFANIFGSSIAFMHATNTSNFDLEKLIFSAPEDYSINLYDNTLWLYYSGYGDNFWNGFVAKFQDAQNSIILTQNISPTDSPNSFANPNTDNFTIDGNNKIINATEISDLGFSLNQKTLTFKDVTFTSFTRSAGSNGAVFNLDNSNVTFEGNISFAHNRADFGAAIYANNNSQIIFADGALITFENNKTGTDENDIYLKDELSSLEIAGTVNLPNGFHSAGDGKITKTGSGVVTFSDSNTNIQNPFDINSGAVIFNSPQTTTTIITITQTSTLSLSLNSPFVKRGGSEADGDFAVNSPFVKRGTRMGSEGDFAVAVPAVTEGNSPFAKGGGSVADGGFAVASEGASHEIAGQARNDAERGVVPDAKHSAVTNAERSAVPDAEHSVDNILYTQTLNLSGYLILDFDFQNNTSDFIQISNSLNLTDATLIVNFISRAKTHDDEIIFLQSNSDIDFQNLKLYLEFPDYEIRYWQDTHSLSLHYFGADLLNDITGLGNTFNRIQTENYLVHLSQKNDNQLLDEIWKIRQADGTRQARRTLDMIGGTFLAEALLQAAPDQNVQSLYTKTKMIAVQEEDGTFVRLLSNSAWAEFDGSHLTIDHQENSFLGNTTNINSTLRAGTVLILQNDLSVGAFISASNNLIEQTNNKALLNSIEGGFYGGLFRKNLEYKAHLSAGQHDFQTRRDIDLFDSHISRAQFRAYSFKIGGEATYIYKLFKHIDIKPFISARASLLTNEQINEHGDELTNLKVASRDYSSFTGFAGIKIERPNEELSYYGKVEVGYLFAGNNSEAQYDMTFKDSLGRGEMKIRGLEITPLTIALASGVEIPVSQLINFYADAQYNKGINITMVQANVGLKIMFGLNEQMKRYKERKAISQKEKARVLEQQKMERERLEAEQRAERERLEAEQRAARLKFLEEREKEKELARLEKEKQKELERLEKERIKELARLEKERLAEIERQEKLEAQKRREKAQRSFKLLAASFGPSSAKLSNEAKNNIAKMAKEIADLNYDLITVEGHADSQGSAKFNDNLAKKRAQSVEQEFLKNGVPKEKIKHISLGSKIPIADNSTPEGRSKNRRAEIFVE